MPTYCYRCDSCKKEEEVVQKISDAPLTVCPSCNKPTFKRVPPKEISIQFKGSGFYITDYKESKGSCDKPGGCSCH